MTSAADLLPGKVADELRRRMEAGETGSFTVFLNVGSITRWEAKASGGLKD